MAAPVMSRLVRFLSLALCLIAVAWFLAFALEQSKTASAHQQASVNAAAAASVREAIQREEKTPSSSGKSGLHTAVDEMFSKISSPFSGLTSGISSQWTLHIVDTLLALAIYGLGLGYLARVLRFSN